MPQAPVPRLHDPQIVPHAPAILRKDEVYCEHAIEWRARHAGRLGHQHAADVMVEIVETLPRNAAGKVMRAELRTLAKAEGAPPTPAGVGS